MYISPVSTRPWARVFSGRHVSDLWEACLWDGEDAGRPRHVPQNLLQVSALQANTNVSTFRSCTTHALHMHYMCTTYALHALQWLHCCMNESFGIFKTAALILVSSPSRVESQTSLLKYYTSLLTISALSVLIRVTHCIPPCHICRFNVNVYFNVI